MQSEANSNVYQILVHEMNWKRSLRFFFFFWEGREEGRGGRGGGGRELFIIRDHDLFGGILVLCIFISDSSVFINDTCIQHQ